MKAESKLLTRRRLISRGQEGIKSCIQGFPRSNGSVYHIWLEMLRSACLETGDSGSLEQRRTTPSDSPKEAQDVQPIAQAKTLSEL
jgi:hypothetical protein